LGFNLYVCVRACVHTRRAAPEGSATRRNFERYRATSAADVVEYDAHATDRARDKLCTVARAPAYANQIRRRVVSLPFCLSVSLSRYYCCTRTGPSRVCVRRFLSGRMSPTAAEDARFSNHGRVQRYATRTDRVSKFLRNPPESV